MDEIIHTCKIHTVENKAFLCGPKEGGELTQYLESKKDQNITRFPHL